MKPVPLCMGLCGDHRDTLASQTTPQPPKKKLHQVLVLTLLSLGGEVYILCLGLDFCLLLTPDLTWPVLLLSAGVSNSVSLTELMIFPHPKKTQLLLCFLYVKSGNLVGFSPCSAPPIPTLHVPS